MKMTMTMNGACARIAVARGQMLTLPDADGTRVSCVTGALWITQESDHDDLVLLGGQSMHISRNGATLIYGCRESELRICALHAPMAPAAGPDSRLAGLVLPWFAAWRGR
jgi:hypothetical protein